MRKELSIDEKQGIVNAYNAGTGLEAIATEFHVGKLKVKAVLDELGVKQQVKHLRVPKQYVVKDASIKKYPDVPGKHYVCTCKLDGFKTNDYMNKGGFLTSHLEKECGIEVPTLWKRNEYYKLTGNYWHEQYYDIELVDDNPTIKCPYCDWKSEDVDNKSGMFETHLKKAHGITKMEFLHEHPEWRDYFRLVNKTKDREMETDESKFVTCAICGKKLARIDWKHLAKHGISKLEYLQLYGDKTISDDYRTFLLGLCNHMNTVVEKDQDKFTSKYETEIRDYIRSLGFEDASKNRSLLNGKEIDIYIPSKHLAIEFNGCMWHSEFFGKKDRKYHLTKTELCKKHGVNLIHIFDDEWVTRQDIVKDKIRTMLCVNKPQRKIFARTCIVKQIGAPVAMEFLDKYHIQYSTQSTLHYGLYTNDGELVAVMSFLNENNGRWNLTRFATNINYIIPGAGGKLLTQFIRENNPDSIKSFLDRRWCYNEDNNLYTKLGFRFDGYTKPDYRYYNPSVSPFARIHKFNFRKATLHRRYGLPLELSETEMARSLGYDRIWDCGLIRYVWSKSSD